ncbi:MAG: phosphatidylglycerophosphatase A family protein [bacterium]
MITSAEQLKSRRKKLALRPLGWLAFGFGSGLFPKAPGTAGTLLAAVLLYVLQLSGLTDIALLVLVVISSIAGIWICGWASKALNVHDDGSIVWDEFAGFWLCMLWIPHGLTWLGAGFVLFRIFDIFKPWPISWLDKKVHGGLGIMLDDTLAGFFAWLVMQAVIYLW